MSNNYFRFKQFTVYQDKTAMKVGVDSVLLGSWIECDNAQNILDIGTGTGLLALMLAQKTSVPIVAVELDENAYTQAVENIKNCIWDNISVIKSSIQDYAKNSNARYDLIVCNPPYFHNSFVSQNLQRRTARHDNSLTISSLVQCVSQLLSANGRFCMIYPYERKKQVFEEAAKFKLYPKNTLLVKGSTLKNPNRIVIEFTESITSEFKNEHIIAIRNGETNEYTDEYKMMTKEYYLQNR